MEQRSPNLRSAAQNQAVAGLAVRLEHLHLGAPHSRLPKRSDLRFDSPVDHEHFF